MAAKKKRSHSKGKGKKSEEPVAIEQKDLERFAGSSEEEDNQNDKDHEESDNELEAEEKEKEQKEVKKDGAKHKKRKKSTDNDNASKNSNDEASEGGAAGDKEANSDSEEEEEDSDFEQTNAFNSATGKKQGAAGMADVMLKILGTQPPTKKVKMMGSAVLSKTVTPLQKALQKEREEAKASREKRKLKTDNPLPSLHIPMSVATTMPTANVSKELELERLHRRVATRGVVALFNAVAQHQQKKPSEEETTTTAKTSKSKEVQKMTKHGFLDMIKTAAVSNKKEDGDDKGNQTSKKTTTGKSDEQPSKWMALQDDYLMNPKKVSVAG